MLDSGRNIRFRVKLNGKRIATVGIKEDGVIGIIVNWVRRPPSRKPRSYGLKKWIHNKATLNVGGLDSTVDQSLHWKNRQLQPGDKVTIEVLPPGAIDHARHRSDVPRRSPRRAKTMKQTTLTKK